MDTYSHQEEQHYRKLQIDVFGSFLHGFNEIGLAIDFKIPSSI
jgi:hypothetical protein